MAKVTFDGPNKVITVDPGVTALDIRIDVYSDWKEWVQLGNNSVYPPAIRTVGGDTIDEFGGVFAGDLYFLINNWKLAVDVTETRISGILYSDDYESAYTNKSGIPIFPPVVSSIVNTIATGALSETQISGAVWNALQADYNTVGTMGAAQNDIEFIGKNIWVNTDLISNGNGMQGAPFNNITDAIDLAEAMGIYDIILIGDIILDRNVKNLNITGIGVPEFDCNGFQVTGSHFTEVRFKGQYTGHVVVRSSLLVHDTWLNGFFENCALDGDMHCVANADVLLKDCSSNIAGTSRPSISMNSGSPTQLSIRGYSGGLDILDSDHVDDNCTVEMLAGNLKFTSSCVLGTMVARGVGEFADETNGATVIDETLSQTSLATNVNIDGAAANAISDAVWNKLLADMIVADSAGERFKKLITLNQWMGLK